MQYNELPVPVNQVYNHQEQGVVDHYVPTNYQNAGSDFNMQHDGHHQPEYQEYGGGSAQWNSAPVHMSPVPQYGYGEQAGPRRHPPRRPVMNMPSFPYGPQRGTGYGYGRVPHAPYRMPPRRHYVNYRDRFGYRVRNNQYGGGRPVDWMDVDCYDDWY